MSNPHGQQPPPYSQQTHPGWVPQGPPARSRTPVYAALAVAVVAVVCVGAAVWYFGSQAIEAEPAVAQPAASTVSPSPSKTWDQSTLSACEEAQLAVSKDDPGQRHAERAMSDAELSDVAALRGIASKYGEDLSYDDVGNSIRQFTGALRIATWCITHKVTKVG